MIHKQPRHDGQRDKDVAEGVDIIGQMRHGGPGEHETPEMV